MGRKPSGIDRHKSWKTIVSQKSIKGNTFKSMWVGVGARP